MKIYIVYYWDCSRIDIDELFLSKEKASEYIENSNIRDYLFLDELSIEDDSKLQELNRKIVDHLAEKNL